MQSARALVMILDFTSWLLSNHFPVPNMKQIYLFSKLKKVNKLSCVSKESTV